MYESFVTCFDHDRNTHDKHSVLRYPFLKISVKRCRLYISLYVYLDFESGVVHENFATNSVCVKVLNYEM